MHVLFIWANIPIDLFAVVNAAEDEGMLPTFDVALDTDDSVEDLDVIERNAVAYFETNVAGDSFDSSSTNETK